MVNQFLPLAVPTSRSLRALFTRPSHALHAAFTLVGLPDKSLTESKDRVRAAVVNSGGGWPQKKLTVKATGEGGTKEFTALCRIDTPNELDYYRHGGILLYVMRQLAKA